MELYLIKSAVILTILYGFYKLVLENESMHVFKRFYLLGSLPAAFLIPLVTFTSYVEVPVSSAPVFIGNSLTMPMAAPEVSVNLWPYVIWGLYALGMVFFSIKFGKNLIQLISKIRNNPKFTRDSIHHILLKTPVLPHTFLNYVFLNKQKFESGEIPDEVIQHEHVHAKQKHSIDILTVEFLQIIFWFNPLLYFMKRSIKLNHEFLADRAVLNQGTDPIAYQNLLLAFSSHAITPALANSINYSFIKKRFTVMKKQTSTQGILVRSLILLPFLALLVYGFSSKEVIQKEVITEKAQTDFQQEKATKAEIQEYNTLAKKYNAMTRDKVRLITEEIDRMKFIYNKMTPQQTQNGEPFPTVLPAQPPTPPAPKVRQTSSMQSAPPFPTIYTVPQPPPAPNDDPIEYIKELTKSGAMFYIGPHRYNSAEVIEIAKKSKDFKLDVSNFPKVNLPGC